MSVANTHFTLLHSITLHTCQFSTSDRSSLSKYSLENDFSGYTCLQKMRFMTYHGVWLLGRELVQDSVSRQYLFEVLLEVFGLLINLSCSTPALACKARHGYYNITAYFLAVIGKWTLESYLPTSQELLLEMVKCQSNSCLVSSQMEIHPSLTSSTLLQHLV